MPGMGMGVNPGIRASYMAPRSLGLFGRIGNGIRGFNWRGLLSGANKTLEVVNQTIPLIRQAKPMFNNMRSMVQLAKAFGSETTSGRGRNKNNRHTNNFNSNSKNVVNGNIESVNNNSNTNDSQQKKEVQNDNYPNFFI